MSMNYIEQCESFVNEVAEWEKRVNLFAALSPTKTPSKEDMKNYLLLHNFFWTEYEFLYKGKKISDYRRTSTTQEDFAFYDKIEETIMRRKKNFKTKEKIIFRRKSRIICI